MLGIHNSLRNQNNSNVGLFKTRRPLLIIPRDYDDNENMTGKGIIDNMKALIENISPNIVTNILNRIPASNDTARPLYNGEKHTMLKLPNGKIGVANYMGPGTEVIKRLIRNDPPRTETDKVSKAHDIRYVLANDLNDIRTADKILIKKIDEISKNKTDSKFNIAQAKLIKVKMISEDLGLLKRTAFSGDLSKKILSQDDITLMNEKLKPLEMAGYGKSPAFELKKIALSKVKSMNIKGAGIIDNIIPMLDDIKKYVGNNLLPIANTISSLSPKESAAKILPYILKKMKGNGISKLKEKQLMKHLEKAIMNVKKGQSGKGMYGKGFFDRFVTMLKTVGAPIAKAAIAGLSVVQPELGIPLGIIGSIL
jgi:hypothetical protein